MPALVVVVGAALARISLSTAAEVRVHPVRFTSPGWDIALAAMIVPVAVLNYFWPRLLLLNLAALLVPIWYEMAVAGHEYGRVQASATPLLAWSAVVSGLAIFLGLAGWVGGRMREGSAVEPPPGFEVKSMPTW